MQTRNPVTRAVWKKVILCFRRNSKISFVRLELLPAGGLLWWLDTGDEDEVLPPSFMYRCRPPGFRSMFTSSSSSSSSLFTFSYLVIPIPALQYTFTKFDFIWSSLRSFWKKGSRKWQIICYCGADICWSATFTFPKRVDYIHCILCCCWNWTKFTSSLLSLLWKKTYGKENKTLSLKFLPLFLLSQCYYHRNNNTHWGNSVPRLKR